MSEGNKKYDLEERLIQFALMIIDIVEMLPNTRAGNHIAGQLIRSGTSPACLVICYLLKVRLLCMRGSYYFF
jgi:hypothetical protein